MISRQVKLSLANLFVVLLWQLQFKQNGHVAGDSIHNGNLRENEYNTLEATTLDLDQLNSRDEDKVKEIDEDEEYDYKDEIKRIKKYHKLGYVWPIPDSSFKPNTTGYLQHIRKRIEQIDKNPDKESRWFGFTTITTIAMVVPNFTEHGFGLVKCIDFELMDELRKTVREGFETAELEGSKNGLMSGPLPPVKIENEALTTRVFTELHRYAEAWSGIKLLPYGAYGFRVYRNGTELKMHTDIADTHIISFILHIDHSDDGTPWPLVLEDYHGNTHEVTLESGDMLFYESAKTFHGRPRPFNGTWYCSVFVHYYPAEGWLGKDIDKESAYTMPPNWQQQLLEEHTLDVPRMEVIRTGFIEPECEHRWCGLQNSIKWGGPAEAGVWMAPNMQKYPLYIPEYIEPLEYSEEYTEEYEL